jgi:hypothetical protein
VQIIVAPALKIAKIADAGMPPNYETMHYRMLIVGPTVVRHV